MSGPSLTFLEQTDFSLRLARVANLERSMRIEEMKELTPEAAATFLSALSSDTVIACAVRPKSRALHLASGDEAKRFSGFTGIRKFAEMCSVSTNPMTWFSAVHARDGGPPSNTPWVLSGSADQDPYLTGTFANLKVKPARAVSATLLTAGALASSVDHPVLMIEVGELASHALLVGREGVLAAGAVSLDLSRIAEAIQTELNLKFRGSATKLFFNSEYDFSEQGPKIVARLAEGLKSELNRFIVDRPAPNALFVSGLPAAQQWFGPQLADALGLQSHLPDPRSLAKMGGLAFAEADFKLSPWWLGLVHFVQLHAVSKLTTPAPWEAEWISVTASPATLEAVEAAAVSAVAAPSTTKPTAPGTPSALKSSPTAPPFTPGPTSGATNPQFKTLIGSAASAASKQSGGTSSASKPTVTSAPFGKTPPTPPPPPKKPAPIPVTPFPSPKKRTRPPRGVILIAIVLFVGAVAGSYFYFQHAKTVQIAEEKARLEARVKSEREKARIAEQKAQLEAENRQKLEIELKQKLASAEAARVAEAEAQAAALANAQGSLVIATNPIGAKVTVGDLPAKPSPATFTELKVGTYPVTVSMPHYEDAHFDLTVKANSTTDAGTITLIPIVGTLKITSEPGTASYEIAPTDTLFALAETRRSGQAPASIEDLPVGNYTVTLTRDGWAPHSQIVSISRNATTYLRWSWPNAVVKITTTPSGASVSRNGTVLGNTPLTLTDQTPGDVRYDVSLPHFDTVPLTATLVSGQAFDLSAEFKPEDRVYTTDELDRKPEAAGGNKQPELPYYLKLEGGRAEIQITIGRDGAVRSASVVQTSNPEIGKFCVAAVTKWQFKPAIKSGAAVNSTMRLPFVFKPTKA